MGPYRVPSTGEPNAASPRVTGAGSPIPPSPPQVGPPTVSFGEPSVIRPTVSARSFVGMNNRTLPFAEWQSRNTMSIPAPHLEAYVIRPSQSISETTFVLSHNVENLHLSERDLQSYIQQLGPDYSIVNAIHSLHPQILSLIQSRTVQRQGTIVSIEHGKPSNITTSMGSLEIRSTIFVISTSTILPPKSSPIGAPVPLHGTLSRDHWKDGTRHFAKPVPTPASSDHGSPPERYHTSSKEHCTHVEGSRIKDLGQFQSIAAKKDWQNPGRSFEEIRRADYNPGRKGPAGNEQASDPDDNRKGLSPATTINPHHTTSALNINNARFRFEAAPSIWPPSLTGHSLLTKATPGADIVNSGLFGGVKGEPLSVSPFGLLASQSKSAPFGATNSFLGTSFASPPHLKEGRQNAATSATTSPHSLAQPEHTPQNSWKMKKPEASETTPVQGDTRTKVESHDNAALSNLWLPR